MILQKLHLHINLFREQSVVGRFKFTYDISLKKLITMVFKKLYASSFFDQRQNLAITRLSIGPHLLNTLLLNR